MLSPTQMLDDVVALTRRDNIDLANPMHARFQKRAHMVVTNPTNYAGRSTLRLVAWTTLKAARGQTVNQTQLNVMLRNQHVAGTNA